VSKKCKNEFKKDERVTKSCVENFFADTFLNVASIFFDDKLAPTKNYF